MKVELANDYYIEVSKSGYLLKKRKRGTSKTGEPITSYRPCGFHKTLRGAVEKFIELNQLRDSTVHTFLFDYVEMVERSNKEAVTRIVASVEGTQKE